MKVFVAGATGALGSRVVPLLLRVGHQVSAVARTPAKADALRAAGAEPVTVSLFEPAPLIDAISGHDIVVNLATHIPDLSRAARSSAWAENDRIRTVGSRNLVDAALAAGASRYVQESLSFYYVDSGAAWVDEDVAVKVPAASASVQTAEAQASRFAESGAAGVVLRFGFFYGTGSAHTLSQIALARRGISPFPGAQDGYQALLHLNDAATAVAAALEVPPGVYNVSEDEPATRRELAAALAAALGRRAGVALPGVAKLGGRRAEYLSRSVRVTNRRFRAASGWLPSYPTPALGWAQVVAEGAGAGGENRSD
jgi:nucleoside-diphosphate-sugar epimerase